MSLEKLKALKVKADNETGFAEKALAVFRAKGFTDSDIEDAKSQIREAWSDEHLKGLWINWINECHRDGWR